AVDVEAASFGRGGVAGDGAVLDRHWALGTVNAPDAAARVRAVAGDGAARDGERTDARAGVDGSALRGGVAGQGAPAERQHAVVDGESAAGDAGGVVGKRGRGDRATALVVDGAAGSAPDPGAGDNALCGVPGEGAAADRKSGAVIPDGAALELRGVSG